VADGAYQRSDDRYYPGTGGNEPPPNSSFSSLKQTLAQTISNLAAASASASAVQGSVQHGPGGGYANPAAQDYGAYNPQAGRPAGANQGYNAAPAAGAPYNDPRVLRDVRDVREASAGAPYNVQGINQARVGTTHARYVPDIASTQRPVGNAAYDPRVADGGYTQSHLQGPDRGYQPAPTLGAVALGQNPPNTTGFYNRRPAQDAAPQSTTLDQCLMMLS
jgi:hypothetical protein